MVKENYINHVALVLDGSLSMSHLQNEVIRVADAQVTHLAQTSKELDQETRITVYVFDDTVRCLIFDKDVLRLPSIRDVYRIGGNTALIDATMKSQQDLEDTSVLYGDHAFLTYVLTDGEENRSRLHTRYDLQKKLTSQPDNWTVAAFVPNDVGLRYAREVGFFSGNISKWDASSRAGFAAAGDKIKQATDNFMRARATGTFKGTNNLFSMDTANLNKTTVSAANLAPLAKGKYQLVPVVTAKGVDLIEKNGSGGRIDKFVRIDEFVGAVVPTGYRVGKAYYQLVKPEKVQGDKDIAVVEKKTQKVYTGANARALLGLPDYEVRVKPEGNPDWDVYIQSSSLNRHLPIGTKVLVLA